LLAFVDSRLGVVDGSIQYATEQGRKSSETCSTTGWNCQGEAMAVLDKVIKL
jgi:hypothetical protein